MSGMGGGGGGWAKSAPHSIEDTTQLANPGYRTLDSRFEQNCQRVAWAAELLRRGYDVEALPYDNAKDGKNGGFATNKNYMRIVEGNENLEKTVTVRARTASSAVDKIRDIMKSYGDGARAMIAITWKTGDGKGHVFNLETLKGGDVVGYDAQNPYKRGRDVLSDYIREAVLSPKYPIRQIRILRLDDVKIDPSKFAEIVKPKGD